MSIVRCQNDGSAMYDHGGVADIPTGTAPAVPSVGSGPTAGPVHNGTGRKARPKGSTAPASILGKGKVFD